MQPKLLLPAVLVPVALLLAFRLAERPVAAALTNRQPVRAVIRCTPDWNVLGAVIDESDIPPLPGSGNYKWPIDTKSDSAQFYFNQGINTYYGFHIIESMASFRKAAQFDSTSAMVYWGQALAAGPNINDVAYAATPEALLSIQKAAAMSAGAEEKVRLLIDAQQVRYSADSTIPRTTLNQAYADKMKALYIRFPRDADVAALYADALMLQHPWDLWTPDGKPKPWTPVIRSVLEKLLEQRPDHPGANHYYIHVMEPSPFAEKALASADRLGALNPGLSHLVHMPSHIYLRTGNYEKGVSVNEAAVNAYEQYRQLYSPVAANDFLYVIHNLHMQANNAMMQGNLAAARKAAAATVRNIPNDYLTIPGAMGNYLQYIAQTPLFVQLRFGQWDSLLTMPAPAPAQVYANVLYHFGRGMAYAQLARLREARLELDALKTLKKDTVLQLPFSPFSAAIDGASIGEQLLSGSIALAERKYDEAISHFRAAVATEDNMVYNEPRDWLLSPRHYLGNACLKGGYWEEARRVFSRDLEYNQENGWSLFGLYLTLTNGSKKAEADRVLRRFNAAFAGADTRLISSVF